MHQNLSNVTKDTLKITALKMHCGLYVDYVSIHLKKLTKGREMHF